jgi:hypothetical protein
MLVFICSDGVARVGDQGGVVRYASVEEIAGLSVPPVVIDMTVERLSRALANTGSPAWRRAMGLFGRRD